MSKTHLLKRLLLSALFFLGVSSSYAQKNFTIRHFDESSGLTSNFTEAITQSEIDGQLIIANKAGITRFDGRVFGKLTLQDDTVNVDYATCLHRDRKSVVRVCDHV